MNLRGFRQFIFKIECALPQKELMKICRRRLGLDEIADKTHELQAHVRVYCSGSLNHNCPIRLFLPDREDPARLRCCHALTTCSADFRGIREAAAGHVNDGINGNHQRNYAGEQSCQCCQPYPLRQCAAQRASSERHSASRTTPAAIA